MGTHLPMQAVSMGIVSAPRIGGITKRSASQWSVIVALGAGVSVSLGDTSICLVLLGVAAAIGLASFGEYLFEWDVGIDQFLFADSPKEAVRSVGPGLMAPLNALNFYFLGLAVLLSWTTLHKAWPSQVLNFSAGLLSLVDLLDFLVAPSGLLTYASLPAALAVAILSSTIVCARLVSTNKK